MPPSLAHIIPPSNNAWVKGLALAEDKLYVTRHTTKQIDVYDTTTFQLRHSIKVPDAGYLYGLAACAHYKCLYAADFNEKKVHRIDVLANEQTMSWALDQCPSGLSVTKEHRVLIAYEAANVLDEYSTDGTPGGTQLTRRIKFDLNISGLQHALELNTSDRLVISCGWGSTHTVHELSPEGAVVRSYCEGNSTSAKELNGIGCLAIYENNILVPDWSSTGRIIVLNSSLNWSHDLLLPPTVNGLQEPYVLCFDETKRRLYVGEHGGKRILVFDDVQVTSTAT